METFSGAAGAGPARERREEDGLPFSAKAYFTVVVGVAAVAAGPIVAELHAGPGDWLTFVLLATAAGLAQLFVVITPRNQSYHSTIAFLVPAVILLPPGMLALVPIIQHVPEWLRARYRWYIQVFNIANYVVDLLAAQVVFHLIMSADGLVGTESTRGAIAGFAAVGALVLLNHSILAGMLKLGRGHSLAQTGLFTFESISTDLVLSAVGLAIATFWSSNPLLIPVVVAPLLLIHRSLKIPALQEEASLDSKTGLFNPRHFGVALAAELDRATRAERPFSLIMADLDLLREINNTHGHLAGDAVLRGTAEEFKKALRPYDVAARFGGEEFCMLLPETEPAQALDIAERLRLMIAARSYTAEASSEPIRATISIGVAGFPEHGTEVSELIHRADLAVYRAKAQGRNRVVGAGSDTVPVRIGPMPERARDHHVSHASDPSAPVEQPRRANEERRLNPQPHLRGRLILKLSVRLRFLVGLVSLVGLAASVAGAIFGSSTDIVGLVALVTLVALGQALALESSTGSISVGAVGALAGAALFGPRGALALAVASVAIEWSSRRPPLHRVIFNLGALSLASLTAAGVFHAGHMLQDSLLMLVASGITAGGAYFLVNTGLVSLALAIEDRSSWRAVLRGRFMWLAPHYLSYGLIGGTIAATYRSTGLFALAAFAIPLFVMRKTQEAYLTHTERSAGELGRAAKTIQAQNSSLEEANRLLRERSTAAMESLSATVDARDSYTAGHSRRVRDLSLAIGRELALSSAELDVLAYAALFHDIGKLAVPDSILLKPSSLSESEWEVMRRHPEEGARIIGRLGFLDAAVSAIRHHHENYDGNGYPDGRSGEDIPISARIIHVADAIDSMLTDRVYRAARPAEKALAEIRGRAGTQFCPQCVFGLERIVASSEFFERSYTYSVLGLTAHRPFAAAAEGLK
jgi:diguanylate cyclase (GGDEF)-like protein/putative nucleotidyltransferase with HDIG domain